MKVLMVAAAAALTMLAPTLLASPSAKFYVADATAVIDIAADGGVDNVKLTGVPGDVARDAYERQIRAWRFEPVLDDGVAAPARAHAHLRLVAHETEDGGFSLTMRDPIFLDPPDARSFGGPEGLQLLERRVPMYPARSANAAIQADVMLLLDIASDGSVRRAGVYSAMLLGSSANIRHPDSALRPIVESARRATMRWRFQASEEDDRSVLVPINFSLHDYDNRWQQARTVESAREEWVEAFLDARQSVDARVAEFQPGNSMRFVLLSPLEQPVL